MSLLSVNSLPKMDGILGKCDPYATLRFQERDYKTDVVKNSYDAEWMAKFNLDVDDAAKGTRSDIIVTVWDWDAASADDEIGSFKISAARVSEMCRAALGSGAEDTFIVCEGGRPVLGQDKKRCRVCASVKVCEVPIAFPSIETVEGTKGPRRLEMCVSAVSNLPNMDGIMGKCDPYAILMFNGVEFRTETKKNCYVATWEAWFNLDVDDAAKGIITDCTVTVWDWDATSKDDMVGSFAIPARRMGELFCSSLGGQALHKFAVEDSGRPVIGHNKAVCEVDIKVKVSEVPVAWAFIEPEEGAKGSRRLELTVSTVSSLPKMDGLLGKCDPYAVVIFEGIERRTATKKNCFDADFNETFNLDLDDAAVGTRSDIFVSVWDWDAASADDEVGGFRVPFDRVSEVFRGKLGSTDEHSFTVSSMGIPVLGNDKKTCIVSPCPTE